MIELLDELDRLETEVRQQLGKLHTNTSRALRKTWTMEDKRQELVHLIEQSHSLGFAFDKQRQRPSLVHQLDHSNVFPFVKPSKI